MTIKVLVADDSQTIQKVVKITLSELSYELTQVLDEHTLIEEVETEHYDLVLLDFGLSQTVSGYDLAASIKEKSPETMIMAMLGTFDTINDSQMLESGISDKITKPFESEKFIKKCQALIDSDSESYEINDPFAGEDDLAGGWVVDSPKVEDKRPTLEVLSDSSEDKLAQEMKGWGVEVPSIIEGSTNDFGEFPPVIEGADNIAFLRGDQEEELPEQDDLAYPDDDSGVDYIGSSEESLRSVRFPGSPKEIEEEDFSASDSHDEEHVASILDEDATDPNFQMPLELMSPSENGEEDILEVSADDFWAADEGHEEGHEEALELVESGKTEEVEVADELQAEVEMEPIQEQVEVIAQNEIREVVKVAEIDEDKIVERITANLKPLLESMVREYCHTNVDKVAWEVIPDLAENLIRKEIKEISQSVIDRN